MSLNAYDLLLAAVGVLLVAGLVVSRVFVLLAFLLVLVGLFILSP